MGFLTYIVKVVLAIFGFILAAFAVYLALQNITDMLMVALAFIIFVIGVAMVWYGRELED